MLVLAFVTGQLDKAAQDNHDLAQRCTPWLQDRGNPARVAAPCVAMQRLSFTAKQQA